MSKTHRGGCFCGTVAIEATGDPVDMGFCHCADCRSYAGAPVSAFTLWRSGQVTVTQGTEFLAGFNKTGFSHRRYCSRCGGHVFVDHPTLGMVDVHAATLPNLEFVPTVHLNYGASVLEIRDELPKFKDFPAEIGGSGERLPE